MKTYRAIVTAIKPSGVSVRVPMQYNTVYEDLQVYIGVVNDLVVGDKVLITQASNDNDDFVITGITPATNIKQSIATDHVSAKTIVASQSVTANSLSVTNGLSAASGTISGALSSGSYTTGGTINATGSITGGSLSTSGNINASGSITGGSLSTSGNISATGSITANTVTATGAVTGNALSAGAAGQIYGNRVRLVSETDVSPASTGHAFQIGADGGANLAIDNNEIMARSNGAITQLWLGNPNLAPEGSMNRSSASSAFTTKAYVDELSLHSAAPVLSGDYSSVATWRNVAEGIYRVSGGITAGRPNGSTAGFVTVKRSGNDGVVTWYAFSSANVYTFAFNASTAAVVWDQTFQHRDVETTGTVNLDDYTTPGIYHFNQDVTATNGSNFPLNAAGVCEVMGVGTMRYQRYTAYRSYPGHVYYRNQYAGTWGKWEQIGRGMCSGGMTIALPTQGTVANASVSFPTNRFNTAPSVSVSHWTTVPQNANSSFSTLSATGMVVHAVRTVGTGDLNVRWIAVGFGI